MKMVVCASCGKEYDASAFSAGVKYCTKQCRYTKNDTVSMGRKYLGRNRRFPRVGYQEMRAIVDQLELWGLKVSVRMPIKTPIPCVFNVRVGMRQIPLVIGGLRNELKRAHVAAWYEAGILRFGSTCTKTRNRIEVPDGLKTKTVTKLTPCHHQDCLRCMDAQLLRTTYEKIAEHYSSVEIGHVN